MSEVRIVAEPRTEFGKGAARRIRRAHKVPAVLYGHGTAPRHVSLPGHALMLALKTPNALLSLDLGNGEAELALPKSVQRDPIKGFLEHVDLILVSRGEQVTVEVPVVFTGEAPADVVVEHQLTALPVRAEATHLPQAIEADVSALAAGRSLTASDLRLPAGTQLAVDPDTPIAHASAARTSEEVAAELEVAEAELAAVGAGAAAQAAAATSGTGDVVPDTATAAGGPEASPA